MGKQKWQVYLLECKDGSYYTGITNDLTKRIDKHKKGEGSKYVNSKGFKKLIASKKCKNRSQASKYEYNIKQLSRQEKLNWFN